MSIEFVKSSGKKNLPSTSCTTNNPKNDIQISSVNPFSVQVQTTNNSNRKRKWDKFPYCVYCMNKYPKLPRHFENKHSTEKDVVYALSFRKGSTERKILWQKLANKGNHAHNVEILKDGYGYIIPYRRPSFTVPVSQYLPCPECLGWFIRAELYKHNKICPVKLFENATPKLIHRRIQQVAGMLLPHSDNVTEGMADRVLSRMTQDEVTVIARNDYLIIEFGSREYMKVGTESAKIQYVKQKMRELAKLLIELRKISKKNASSLKEYIHPSKFEIVIQATQQLADYNLDDRVLGKPSLALKLGHSLKKCTTICMAEAIKNEDSINELAAKKFLKLCEIQWAQSMSSHALNTMNKKKRNMPKFLPLVEDVVKVNMYLKKTATDAYKDLQEDTTTSTWKNLSEITLAQLILFNRRRSGEMERMLLEDFREVRGVNQEAGSSLTSWEQNLCRLIDRVEIKGKRGRNVPVLLTKDLCNRIKLLIEKRKDVKVNVANPYIFARLQNSLRPVRAQYA
ncbi:uncharacterized protein LOC102801744 [Saccoglossus kowalevskii]|uniref:Uncharacterized protein LOC102801744 n=1 Tax=Saccoglossus kowalevskii TaxID=10224 RepID=A0ABM0M2I9_SACKO|nr:PREDICTED: uncharacterized protein LOC102801744 [Saccoglossus kowalevskii]